MKKGLLCLAVGCLGFSYNGSAQAILTQNFETAVAPWTVATTGGGGGWSVVSTATATQLGTIAAHTKYIVVDEGALGSTTYNNPTTLTSPTFSLVGATSPYLSYDKNYFQAWLSAPPNTHELAWIEISTDGGGSWSLLDSITYSASGNWETKFKSLSAYSTSSTCQLRFNYTDQGAHIIGVALDNIMVYDAAVTNISLTSVSPTYGSVADYFMVGATASFSGTITNYSSTAVSSYTAYYQVGTSAPVSTVISAGAPALTAGTTFTISTPYTLPAASQYPVKMWVVATGDIDHTNDSMGTGVIGVAFMPKKRLLFEEATGSWCGWCVRGIVYMDSLFNADSNNVSIISVHNNDPMKNMNASTIAYDHLVSSMISGFPSMVIDRREVSDPSDAFTVYSDEGNYFGFAEIGLKAHISSSGITADVRVKPATNLTGDYRIELAVEEDDVHKGGGANGSNGWKQHNYYAVGGSGHSTTMKTTWINFNTSPTDIDTPAIHYPLVARITLPADVYATNGIAGSLPSTLAVNTIYDYTSPSITLDPSWDVSKLRVVAMLIDNNPTSPSYKQVLNSVATKSPMPGAGIYLGASDVKAGINNMTVFPNPAADEAHVKFVLGNTSTVSCTIVDMTGRVVVTTPEEEMTAGGHQLNIGTSELAPGAYNVTVHTANGSVSQRLSIAK